MRHGGAPIVSVRLVNHTITGDTRWASNYFNVTHPIAMHPELVVEQPIVE